LEDNPPAGTCPDVFGPIGPGCTCNVIDVMDALLSEGSAEAAIGRLGITCEQLRSAVTRYGSHRREIDVAVVRRKVRELVRTCSTDSGLRFAAGARWDWLHDLHRITDLIAGEGLVAGQASSAGRS
jgi:hypothetical protein